MSLNLFWKNYFSRFFKFVVRFLHSKNFSRRRGKNFCYAATSARNKSKRISCFPGQSCLIRKFKIEFPRFIWQLIKLAFPFFFFFFFEFVSQLNRFSFEIWLETGSILVILKIKKWGGGIFNKVFRKLLIRILANLSVLFHLLALTHLNDFKVRSVHKPKISNLKPLKWPYYTRHPIEENCAI